MEKNNETNTVGERIALLRAEWKMTQAELAEQLHVSDKAVSKWETTDSCPDIELFPLLSDIFGVSIDYLVRGEAFRPQKLFVGNPYAPINKIQGKNMIEGLNAHYLSRGWHVVSASQDDADGFSVMIVIERER